MGTVTSYINKVETWAKELLFILLAAFLITKIVIPLLTSGGGHAQSYYPSAYGYGYPPQQYYAQAPQAPQPYYAPQAVPAPYAALN